MKFGYESSVGIQAFNVGQQFQETCLSFEHDCYRNPARKTNTSISTGPQKISKGTEGMEGVKSGP